MSDHRIHSEHPTHHDHLILRLEGPLQSWGKAAIERVRPTHPFPTPSGLTGLIGNALGWTYGDHERLNELQGALHYAALELKRPTVIEDFQTADLATEITSWTTWGEAVTRGRTKRTGHAIGWKYYLASGSFLIALRFAREAPTDLDEIANALQRPARPLFLGRKGCPPSTNIYCAKVEGGTALEAVTTWLSEELQTPGPSILFPRGKRDGDSRTRYRAWAPPENAEGERYRMNALRNFRANRFQGERFFYEQTIELGGLTCS